MWILGLKGLRVGAIKVKTTGTFLSNLARAILRVAAKLDLPTPKKKLMQSKSILALWACTADQSNGKKTPYWRARSYQDKTGNEFASFKIVTNFLYLSCPSRLISSRAEKCFCTTLLITSWKGSILFRHEFSKGVTIHIPCDSIRFRLCKCFLIVIT